MNVGGAHSFPTIVALGSSFAAGPGISPVVNRAAGRSGENSAHLVSRKLGGRLIDATVSGATTATILHDGQRVGRHRFLPQIESVRPDTDLVLLTAGGNDLQYVGSLAARARANGLIRRPLTRSLGRRALRRSPLTQPSDEQVQLAIAGLERIVMECSRRAPRARIILVDYLPVFDDDSTSGPVLPLTESEIRHFRAVAAQLSSLFVVAAKSTGADLVPASAYESGHGAGSAQPYVLGVETRKGDGMPFHPTRAGMRAAADEVLALLGRRSV
ncbi:MAG: SGNH/GDSL hydrolase family protein [Actinomycetales bacterium]|jgi:lysophospholipase L1-like esterase|nr:SGNH/GDSL hydrolase family protein [Leifsonia sp.]